MVRYVCMDVVQLDSRTSKQSGVIRYDSLFSGTRRLCQIQVPAAGPSAAVSVIPGVVFSGAMDGHVRAYETGSGKVIWDVDTMREYETVNALKASGGSLDVGGAAVAGGMLFVSSGYSLWGGTPGNVLLAFSVDGK